MDLKKMEIAGIDAVNIGEFAPYLTKNMAKYCLKKGYEGYGCKYRGQAAATAVVRFSGQEAELLWISVRDILRHRGLGSSLMERCVQSCREKNAASISVRYQDRLYSRFPKFLEKNGFLPTGKGGYIYQASPALLLQSPFFAVPSQDLVDRVRPFESLKSNENFQVRSRIAGGNRPLSGAADGKLSHALFAGGSLKAFALLGRAPEGALIDRIYSGPACKAAELKAVLYASVKNAEKVLEDGAVLSMPVFDDRQAELVGLMIRGILPARKEIVQAVRRL